MANWDAILGNLMNMVGGQQTAPGTNAAPTSTLGRLMPMALQILQQNGGIQGILVKCQQSGLTEQAKSWVSTGANLPISADQVQKVLGSDAVAKIAASLGLSHGDAGNQLANLLPNVIDKMTPNGQVPDNHDDLISQGLSMLSGKMGRA